MAREMERLAGRRRWRHHHQSAQSIPQTLRLPHLQRASDSLTWVEKSLDFSGYFPQGRDDAIDDEIERSSIASVDIRCIETKLPQGRQALFYGFVRVGDSEIVV